MSNLTHYLLKSSMPGVHKSFFFKISRSRIKILGARTVTRSKLQDLQIVFDIASDLVATVTCVPRFVHPCPELIFFNYFLSPCCLVAGDSISCLVSRLGNLVGQN